MVVKQKKNILFKITGWFQDIINISNNTIHIDPFLLRTIYYFIVIIYLCKNVYLLLLYNMVWELLKMHIALLKIIWTPHIATSYHSYLLKALLISNFSLT